MVYAKFGGQTECIMGNWKIDNYTPILRLLQRKYLDTSLIALNLIPISIKSALATVMVTTSCVLL